MKFYKTLGQAAQAPVYLIDRWICDQSLKPEASGNQQYYCCPSGWVRSTYNDPAPCRNEQDLNDCGPLPKGATRSNAVCCSRAKQWFAKTPNIDPCKVFNLKPSEILSSDIDPRLLASRNQILTPTLKLTGIAVIALMLILVVIIQDD